MKKSKCSTFILFLLAIIQALNVSCNIESPEYPKDPVGEKNKTRYIGYPRVVKNQLGGFAVFTGINPEYPIDSNYIELFLGTQSSNPHLIFYHRIFFPDQIPLRGMEYVDSIEATLIYNCDTIGHQKIPDEIIFKDSLSAVRAMNSFINKKKRIYFMRDSIMKSHTYNLK